MASLSILVPVLLLAIFIQDGESVRCWTCTSDLTPACNDQFLGARSGDFSSAIRLENCDANAAALYPQLVNSKSACKKQKKIIDNKLVTIRGCTWKRADDTSNACLNYTARFSNESCITCDNGDGCNGASAVGKTLALLIASLGLILFK